MVVLAPLAGAEEYPQYGALFVAGAGHYDTPLSSPALPQGDPAGPLIMTLWIISGLNSVQRHARPFSRIYIDDRTLVGKPDVLTEAFHRWSLWSSSVGLVENASKAAALAKGKVATQQLREHLPDQVVEELDFLGVSVASVAGRSNSQKEKNRILNCLKVIRFLACIGMPFMRFLAAVRMFALSKCCYGWLTKCPTLSDCKGVWSAIARGSRRMRAASPWLRSVLWGGNTHPDIVCATRLLGTLLRMRLQGLLSWSSVPGHPVFVFHKWLLSRGWNLIRPWVWRHDLTRIRLDLIDPPKVGVAQHDLRDSWRAWCLLQHSHTDRRDAPIVAEYLARASIHRIDWLKIRNWCASSGAARTIAVGASYSPAALQGRTGKPVSCCWEGCNELGTFDHCAWECSYRPNGCVNRPDDALTARFGWTMEGDFAANAIHDWLVRVQTRFWEVNHEHLDVDH